MTPKEKANNLCMSFLMETDIKGESKRQKLVAKQCALICVNEIVKQIKEYTANKFQEPLLNYWVKVVCEIDKL